ncbi:MAG: hypothetical protein K0Q68_2670 [Moraxellaceae bacterium]|jgi:hypothetical protein|nr:hypothetical protein [Moraxellaceae bacterium]
MTTHGLRRVFTLLLLLPALGVASAPPAASPSSPAPAVSGKETVSIDATGTGRSRDEAIAGALALAVLKVQGKEISFDVLSRMFLQSLRDERMVRMNIMNDTRIRATRISTAVAFVQDYQVRQSTRNEDDGHWEARLSAEVVSPAARLAKRSETLQLAILPFVFMQEEESEIGGSAAQAAMKKTLVDIGNFRRNLAGRLERQERVSLHALSPELESAHESAADTPGQVDWTALSRQTGAKHFITVQVEDFRTEAVKLKGNITTSRLDGGYTFHYRLIRHDGGPPEVIKNGTFTIDTRSPFLRPLAMSDSNSQASPQEINRRISVIQDRVAELFANTLLGDLVLPQVIAREGDKLLLKGGASSLRTGDRLAVLGPDVLAPDAGTGLSIRQDGMRIAIIEVTSSTPDRILAQVVKGTAFAVQPGSLLRRIGAGSSGVAAAAIPVEGSAAPAASGKRQP